MENSKITPYEAVTAKIVALIESGELKSWVSPYAPKYGVAKNYFSGHVYSGLNYFLLNVFNGEKLPFYGTFKQIKDAGGSVNKGAKGTRIYFNSMLFKHNGKTITVEEYKALLAKGVEGLSKFFFQKEYVVFSLEDTTGIDYKLPEQVKIEPLNAVQEVISAYKNCPNIVSKRQTGAFYNPLTDTVNVPTVENIINPDSHASTMFHELIHSTGHGTRLKREGILIHGGFGSEIYSFEELIAELGAAMLCGKYGVEAEIENSAAYIKGWLKPLKDDPKLIFKAAAAAQKAVEYMLAA